MAVAAMRGRAALEEPPGVGGADEVGEVDEGDGADMSWPLPPLYIFVSAADTPCRSLVCT